MRNTAILVGLLLFAIGVPVVGTLTSDTGHDEVILVEMYQFDFDFTFENGTKVTNQVTLYTGVAYLFNVTSTDINHGMNIKGNSFNPGVGVYQTTVITFDTVEVINFNCNVFCGAGHGSMNAAITVIDNPNPASTVTETQTVTATVTETTGNDTVTQTETVTTNITSVITQFNETTIENTVELTETESETIVTTVFEQVSLSLVPLIALLGAVGLLRRR